MLLQQELSSMNYGVCVYVNATSFALGLAWSDSSDIAVTASVLLQDEKYPPNAQNSQNEGDHFVRPWLPAPLGARSVPVLKPSPADIGDAVLVIFRQAGPRNSTPWAQAQAILATEWVDWHIEDDGVADRGFKID